jgi:hypothetical protein
MKHQVFSSTRQLKGFLLALMMLAACKEAPKPEATQPEAPKPEATQPETPKPEAPKPETPKSQAYKIFVYDNGPDYTSDGLYRIVGANEKIGYMDSLTSKVVIEPQFDCAFPFENGKAKVSNKCETKKDGEHSTWESKDWYFIDKSGKKLK